MHLIRVKLTGTSGFLLGIFSVLMGFCACGQQRAQKHQEADLCFSAQFTCFTTKPTLDIISEIIYKSQRTNGNFPDSYVSSPNTRFTPANRIKNQILANAAIVESFCASYLSRPKRLSRTAQEGISRSAKFFMSLFSSQGQMTIPCDGKEESIEFEFIAINAIARLVHFCLFDIDKLNIKEKDKKIKKLLNILTRTYFLWKESSKFFSDGYFENQKFEIRRLIALNALIWAKSALVRFRSEYHSAINLNLAKVEFVQAKEKNKIATLVRSMSSGLNGRMFSVNCVLNMLGVQQLPDHVCILLLSYIHMRLKPYLENRLNWGHLIKKTSLFYVNKPVSQINLIGLVIFSDLIVNSGPSRHKEEIIWLVKLGRKEYKKSLFSHSCFFSKFNPKSLPPVIKNAFYFFLVNNVDSV